MQQEQAISERRPPHLSRPLKHAILGALKLAGVFAVARRYHRRHIRILCYHGVWIAHDPFAGDAMFIRADTFKARLTRLQALKFNIITLDQAIDGLKGRTRLPDDAVVITIDDGWFGSFAHMVPALRHHGMPATLYCDSANLKSGQPVWHVMAQYLAKLHGADHSADPELRRELAVASNPAAPVAAKQEGLAKVASMLGIELDRYVKSRAFSYMTPDELKEAANDGLAIELHTHHHTLHDFEPHKVEEEIALNRTALADALGRDPQSFTHFCYPSGVTAPGVEKTLERLGIRSATTLTAGVATSDDDRLLLPRIIDGDTRSALEFEAELCGVSALLRNLRRRARKSRPARGGSLRYARTHSSPY